MKAFHRIYRKIFPPSGYRSPLLSYPVLLMLFIGELWFILRPDFGDVRGGDAETYIAAIDSLSCGIPDVYRTPVYPLVIWLVRSVAGPRHIYAGLQLVNCVAVVVAAWYFMRLGLKFTFGRRRATFWLTAVFCLTPWWHVWVSYTLTESLALSGSVIFLYWLVRDQPGRPGSASVLMASFWLVFLAFLRPILMCLIPLTLCYWFALWRRGGGRWAKVGMSASAACAVMVVCYVFAFGRAHGICKISAVSDWNSYWLLSEAGVMRPGYTENPALARFVERFNSIADTVCAEPLMLHNYGAPDVSDSIPLRDIDALISDCAADNRPAMARYFMARMRILVWNDYLYSYDYYEPLRVIEGVWRPCMGLLLLFQLASAIWLVRLWRRGVRPPGSWFCWSYMMAMSWIAFVSGYYDWARLILPAAPAIAMLAFQMLSFTRPAPKRPLP